MTRDQIRAQIEPHVQGILDDWDWKSPMHCYEGTNHCGGEELDFDIDDIVFLRDLDEGCIQLQPSHRACAAAEWGEDHLFPPLTVSPTHKEWRTT